MKSVRLFFLSGLMLTAGILGSTADTGNEVQPDVLGVKLGMTAAEARLLVAGHHLKQYAETKAKLTFPGSNFAPIEIQGSDYITGMASYTETVVPGKNPPEVEEAFEVLMSAIPGGEKVTDVYRNFTIHPKEKQFAFSALRESFIQKYGKPTIEQDAPFQSRMMWKYFEYSGPREQMRCYSPEDFITPPDALLKVHQPLGAKLWENSVITHKNYSFYYKCFGEYYLQIITHFSNISAPDDQKIVSSYNMGLHSTTKSNEMLSQTEAIIAAAKVRYDKENFDRAKRNTPSN